ncbi:hypothetical protein WMY93_013342 [Mugilogobius chulae]|uniref:Uncharacterized protein n=1 Tax=Mugilogobius chulae TaxID=88201 RepID=A0AAW0NZN9_9GOBI
MLHLMLLIVGVILFETSGLSLYCTNDYDTLMSCHIDEQNCPHFRMTLLHTETNETKTCDFGPCTKGCCCEITTSLLIIDDAFDATVYKDGQPVHSETIEVDKTIKPHTPSIIAVKKLNKMYQVTWKTNARTSILDELLATVIYQKEGDTPKISEDLNVNTIEEMNHWEIGLEPSTTYVFSVKTRRYNVSSDTSEKMKFTTDPSQNGALIAVIVSLCVCAIVLSGVAFVCIIELKGKLWDTVKDEKPTLLDIKPKKEVILKPESLSIYSLSVESLIQKDNLMLSKESLTDSSGQSVQTSGISSGSLDYANTEPIDIEACLLEALKTDLPMFSLCMNTSAGSKQNCMVSADWAPASPLAFENNSYILTQSSKSSDDEQVPGDSGYHSSDTPPLQDFIIADHVLIMETDMSYQPCTQSEDASNASDSHNSLPVIYGQGSFKNMQHQGRLRLRAWLEEQIHSGKYPGVRWLDKPAQIFQIPWKHAARHGWSIDRDATLFRSWAMHTGRYEPGRDKPDPKTWKANFRCALNSLSDIYELREHSKKKGTNAYRVYRMMPNKQTLRRRRGQRSNRSVANRDNDRCPTQLWQTPSIKSTPDSWQKDIFSGPSSHATANDEKEQKEAVFKLMDHLNNSDSWSHMCETRTWKTNSFENHWHWPAEDFTQQTESYNELFPNYIRDLNDWSPYNQTVMQ